MSWNVNLNVDWLRFDNSGATISYYGYNRDPSATDGSNTWSIRQVAGTAVSYVYWNNNAALSYEVSWANRATYFNTPGNFTMSVTASGGFGPSIASVTATGTYSLTAVATSVYSVTFNWAAATGSSRYYVTLYRDNSPIMNLQDGGGAVFNPNQNTFVKQLINTNYITVANCPSGHTYSAVVYAGNGFGTSSTVTTTISL